MKKAQSVYEMYYQYEEPLKRQRDTVCWALKPRRGGEIPDR